MPKLDDDTTDKLFQTGAGRHDFEYSSAAWERMEGLLDADERRRYWWWIGGLVALLVVASGGVYVGYGLEDGAAAEEVLTPGPSPKEKGDRADAGSVAEAQEVIGTKDRSNAPNPTKPTTPLAPAFSHPSTPERGRGRGQSTTSDAPDLKLTTPPAPALIHPPTPERDYGRGAYTVSPLPGKAITSIPYPVERPAPHLAEPQEKSDTATPVFHPYLAATLSFGQTSGTVEAGDFGPRDHRYGARLDYRITNKLSVGTGAYLSNVCYRVDGKNYKASEGFWVQGIVPEDVEADCDVLEVPISVTWFPYGSDRSGLYLGGGLTSYFLRTEQFTFKYGQMPASNAPLSWREENTNNHLFGLGQINLGYQHKAGRRSAFQVEGFVQLPLTKIGHGKVNLMAVGAAVSYVFDVKKSR